MTKATKRKGAVNRLQTATNNASPDERAAKGKALRDTVPRASHAGWKPRQGSPRSG